jgi:toxin ParE1/3/4
MVRRLRREAARLEQFPRLGRVVPEYDDSTIRELIVAPYRLLYRHNERRDRVQVIAVIHGSRQLPSLADIDA